MALSPPMANSSQKLIDSFLESFANIKSVKGDIVIHGDLYKQFRDFIHAKGFFEVEEVNQVQALLDNDHFDYCSRLDEAGTVILVGISSYCKPCLAQQRVLHLLLVSLHTLDEDSETVQKSKVRKKLRVHTALSRLLEIFTDDISLESIRRWMGALALELITDCPQNVSYLSQKVDQHMLYKVGLLVRDQRYQALSVVAASMLQQATLQGASLHTWFCKADAEILASRLPQQPESNFYWFRALEDCLAKLVHSDGGLSRLLPYCFAHSLKIRAKEKKVDYGDDPAVLLLNVSCLVIYVTPNDERNGTQMDIPFANMTEVELFDLAQPASQHVKALRLSLNPDRDGASFYMNAKSSGRNEVTLYFNAQSSPLEMQKQIKSRMRTAGKLLPGTQKILVSEPIDVSVPDMQQVAQEAVQAVDVVRDSVENSLTKGDVQSTTANNMQDALIEVLKDYIEERDAQKEADAKQEALVRKFTSQHIQVESTPRDGPAKPERAKRPTKKDSDKLREECRSSPRRSSRLSPHLQPSSEADHASATPLDLPDSSNKTRKDTASAGKENVSSQPSRSAVTASSKGKTKQVSPQPSTGTRTTQSLTNKKKKGGTKKVGKQVSARSGKVAAESKSRVSPSPADDHRGEDSLQQAKTAKNKTQPASQTQSNKYPTKDRNGGHPIQYGEDVAARKPTKKKKGRATRPLPKLQLQENPTQAGTITRPGVEEHHNEKIEFARSHYVSKGKKKKNNGPKKEAERRSASFSPLPQLESEGLEKDIVFDPEDHEAATHGKLHKAAMSPGKGSLPTTGKGSEMSQEGQNSFTDAKAPVSVEENQAGRLHDNEGQGKSASIVNTNSATRLIRPAKSNLRHLRKGPSDQRKSIDGVRSDPFATKIGQSISGPDGDASKAKAGKPTRDSADRSKKKASKRKESAAVFDLESTHSSDKEIQASKSDVVKASKHRIGEDKLESEPVKKPKRSHNAAKRGTRTSTPEKPPLRKPAIVSFSKSGPRNRGISKAATNASTTRRRLYMNREQQGKSTPEKAAIITNFDSDDTYAPSHLENSVVSTGRSLLKENLMRRKSSQTQVTTGGSPIVVMDGAQEAASYFASNIENRVDEYKRTFPRINERDDPNPEDQVDTPSTLVLSSELQELKQRLQDMEKIIKRYQQQETRRWSIEELQQRLPAGWELRKSAEPDQNQYTSVPADHHNSDGRPDNEHVRGEPRTPVALQHFPFNWEHADSGFVESINQSILRRKDEISPLSAADGVDHRVRDATKEDYKAPNVTDEKLKNGSNYDSISSSGSDETVTSEGQKSPQWLKGRLSRHRDQQRRAKVDSSSPCSSPSSYTRHELTYEPHHKNMHLALMEVIEGFVEQQAKREIALLQYTQNHAHEGQALLAQLFAACDEQLHNQRNAAEAVEKNLIRLCTKSMREIKRISHRARVRPTEDIQNELKTRQKRLLQRLSHAYARLAR